MSAAGVRLIVGTPDTVTAMLAPGVASLKVTKLLRGVDASCRTIGLHQRIGNRCRGRGVFVHVCNRNGDGLGGRPTVVCSLDLNLVVVVTVCRAGGLEIRRVDEGQRTGTAVEVEQRLIRATRQAIGQRIAVGIGRGCGVDRARAFLSETGRASRAENRIVVRISDRDGDGLGGRPPLPSAASISTS